MKLKFFDVVLILFGLFVIYQILLKLFGGSWSVEAIIMALLIFNLGLTWRLNLNFEKHMLWHKFKDGKIK
jgi:hypothetical protein